MASDQPNPVVPLTISAASIAKLHTLLSTLAFSSALFLGLLNHYHRIVKNQYYQYPQEWFPSVSATIGDWFPERNLFQLLIALTSGPRFLLIVLTYIVHTRRATMTVGNGWGSKMLALVAVLRTLSCGGWVFVTSSDSGDTHDVLMILYIVLNLPYMLLHTFNSPRHSHAKSLRRALSTLFFATLVPLVYFYLQHKVHRVAGAYSIYALFEWSLIILDVSFDSIFILDFSDSISPPYTFEIHSSDIASIDTKSTPDRPQRQPTAFELYLRQMSTSTSSSRAFLNDVYLAYLWWTLLTALGPMIFYNSVWSMGLSGWELLLFSILSPIFLTVPPLQRLFSKPFFANVGLLVGIGARWIEDEPDHAKGHGLKRLRCLSLGLTLATMGQVAMWTNCRRLRNVRQSNSAPSSKEVESRQEEEEERIRTKSTTFLFGLVVSLVVKYANHSLNPLWPFLRSTTEEKTNNGGWNEVGIVIGLVALLDSCFRTRSIGASGEGKVVESKKEKEKVEDPIVQTKKAPFGSSFASICGFGGLFFLIVLLFTDTGTTIAWSFNGYPTTGPFNSSHGWMTILSLAVGTSLPIVSPQTADRISSSILTFVIACLCATLTYSQTSWTSYIPSLFLGTYSTLLFPLYLASLTTTPTWTPFKIFLSFFIYCLLVLASTFCVAYAFVPGGNVFRERMDLVVFVTMLLFGSGLYPLRSSSSTSTSTPTSPSSRLFTRSFRRNVQTFFLLTIFTSLLISAWKYHVLWGSVVKANDPENRIISAAIWTVHFGLDGKMWESQRRIAQIVRDAEIDVIGLLESDVHRIVGGNRDITQYISESRGMPYVDLGPSPHKNTWGAALISKFPILRSSHHLLPSPRGELAPAIYATLDVYGVEVDVVVSHNGQEEDPVDRELQSKELGRLMAARWPNPAIFLGYVVTLPHAERPSPYKLLVEDGKIFDIDPTDSDRWCEYVLYRGLHRIGYARLNRGSNPSITDTEIQLGKFVVPYPGSPSSPWSSTGTPSLQLELPLSAEDEELAIEKSMVTETIVAEDAVAPPQRLEPVPVDQLGSHLRLTPAPLPAAVSSPSANDDQTIQVPSSYIPQSLRFPKKLSGPGVRGHFYISLDPHPHDKTSLEPGLAEGIRENPRGGKGPRYFVEKSVKERRDKAEKERLDEECRNM